MADLPPEATDTAKRIFISGGSVADMLEAVVPELRAQERERAYAEIRQLAIDRKAAYPVDGKWVSLDLTWRCELRDFADLIGGE